MFIKVWIISIYLQTLLNYHSLITNFWGLKINNGDLHIRLDIYTVKIVKEKRKKRKQVLSKLFQMGLSVSERRLYIRHLSISDCLLNQSPKLFLLLPV